jgi:hypothetical protein
LPEIWVPFGSVETLVTLEAENLGELIEAEAGQSPPGVSLPSPDVKGASSLFVCDAVPSTLQVLKELSGTLRETGVRIISPAPKKVESGVPELKGQVVTLPPPLPSESGGEPTYSPEVLAEARKVFIGTPRPDPVFGILDSKGLACLNWVSGSRSKATGAGKDLEPSPFLQTPAYDALEDAARGIRQASFVDVVPRKGKAWEVLEDAPFDAILNRFASASAVPGKGLIVGAGGTGYDDTLSSSLRSIWASLPSLRKGGTLLIVAECADGVGSTALEMLATGRASTESGRRDKRLDGIEEVFYLNRLKDEYDVRILSGLPEVYARSNLGLTTSRGSGEAVGRLVNKVGRSGKVNVVPRSAEVRVSSS